MASNVPSSSSSVVFGIQLAASASRYSRYTAKLRTAADLRRRGVNMQHVLPPSVRVHVKLIPFTVVTLATFYHFMTEG